MLYGAVELKLIRDDTQSTVSRLKVMVPDSNKPNKPVFLYKHVINTNRWTDGTFYFNTTNILSSQETSLASFTVYKVIRCLFEICLAP